MATVVTMPKLGATMTEGTILGWYKKEGERVNKEEALVCILTEKVNYEYESPASGILRKILRLPKDIVNVSDPIAIIGTADEDITHLILGEKQISKEHGKEMVIEKKAAMDLPVNGKEIIAYPLAKKIAQERGVDLKAITGTGPKGRITQEDVIKFVEKSKIAPMEKKESALEIRGLSGIRRTIAQRMSESWRNAPHITLSVEVDMTQLSEVRKKILEPIERENGVRVSLTDLLIKIVAKGLEKHLLMNSTFESGQIKISKEINIGVAMAGGEGLIVPIVQNANELSIRKIAQRTKDLYEKMQSGKLALEDVQGGTFTLSNMGMFGIDKFSAIINPPECAILAVGKIGKKPAVIEESIMIRQMAWLTLSADHRIVDGKQAADFIIYIKDMVENSYLLIE